MPPQINVQLSIAGVAKSISDLKQIQAALRSLGGGSGGGGGGGGGISGPASRLQRAWDQLQKATTPTEQFDAAHNLQRARQAMRRAVNPDGDFGKAMSTLIRSTRVGLGGGGAQIMPLLGRFADVLTTLGTVGEFLGGALMGAGTGAMIAAAAFKEAAESIAEMTKASTMAGGNVAGLVAMGIAPNEAAGMARSLRERVGHDPFAMGAAMRAGIPGSALAPRQVGGTDEAAVAQQLLEYLHSIKDASFQLREARRLELEGMLQNVRVSEDVWQRHKQVAVALANGASGNEKAINDLLATWSDLINAVKALLMTALGPAIPLLTNALKDATDEVLAMIQALAALGGVMEGIQKIFHGDIAGGWDMIQTAMDPTVNAMMAAGIKQMLAANTMNNAANTMSQAMKPGTYGGGQRARDAITGGMFSPGLDGWSFRAGAFGY